MNDVLLVPIVVGAHVQFTRDILEGACGDHPTLFLAGKGETGVVTEVDGTKHFPVVVLMDRTIPGKRAGEPYNRDTIYAYYADVEVIN